MKVVFRFVLLLLSLCFFAQARADAPFRITVVTALPTSSASPMYQSSTYPFSFRVSNDTAATFNVRNTLSTSTGAVSNLSGCGLVAANQAATTSLAAGASCTLTGDFTPNAAYTVNSPGGVSLTSNVEGLVFKEQSVGRVMPLLIAQEVSGLPDFSIVESGTHKSNAASVQYRIRNMSSVSVSDFTNAVTLTNPADFSSVTGSCVSASSLSGNAACLNNFSFAPRSTGEKTATIAGTFVFDGVTGNVDSLTDSSTTLADPNLVTASWTTALPSESTINSTSQDAVVTYTNDGPGPVTAFSPSESFANAADFTLDASTCTSTLVAAASCTRTYTFAPLTAGEKTATAAATYTVAGVSGSLGNNAVTTSTASEAANEFAYMIVTSGDNANSIVPINVSDNSADVPIISENFNFIVGAFGTRGNGVDLSNNFIYVLSGNNNFLHKINRSTGQIVTSYNVDGVPEGVVVNSDETRAYVLSLGIFGNELQVINLTSGALITTIDLGESDIGDIVMGPNGNNVYFSAGSSVRVLSTATNTVTKTIELTESAGNNEPMAISPDGAFLYVVGVSGVFDDPTIWTVRLANDTVSRFTFNGGETFSGVVVGPNSDRLYTTDVNLDKVRSYIIGDGTITASTVFDLADSSEPVGIAISPDGSKLFVSNRNSNSASIIALSGGAVSTVDLGGNQASIGEFVG